MICQNAKKFGKCQLIFQAYRGTADWSEWPIWQAEMQLSMTLSCQGQFDVLPQAWEGYYSIILIGLMTHWRGGAKFIAKVVVTDDK